MEKDTDTMTKQGSLKDYLEKAERKQDIDSKDKEYKKALLDMGVIVIE